MSELALGAGASRTSGVRRSADWGGKALLVCALAVLMAIPGLFVFALIAERTHRAETVVSEVSGLQGGPQQVLGPVLIAPYAMPAAPGATPETGWYVVSPETGSMKVRVKTETLRRGIFDVPVYNATAEMDAAFAPLPKTVNLPPEAKIDWTGARIVVGFSDLRGAKADVVGEFADANGKTDMSFAPSSGLGLGSPGLPNRVDRSMIRTDSQGSGLVSAPAAAVTASPAGGVFPATMRFTGAPRLRIRPFAKSTTARVAGGSRSPSSDG